MGEFVREENDEGGFTYTANNIKVGVSYIMPEDIPVNSANKSVTRVVMYDLVIIHNRLDGSDDMYSYEMNVTVNMGNKCKAHTMKQTYRTSGFATYNKCRQLIYNGTGKWIINSPEFNGKVFTVEYELEQELKISDNQKLLSFKEKCYQVPKNKNCNSSKMYSGTPFSTMAIV